MRSFREKRKTLSGDDIVWALENAGFEAYADMARSYLEKVREKMRGSRDDFE